MPHIYIPFTKVKGNALKFYSWEIKTFMVENSLHQRKVF